MNVKCFNKYGFKSDSDFSSLMEKAMDKIGEEYVIGKADENVSIFDPTANGVDSMDVISSMLLAESDAEGDNPETGTTGTTVAPEPEPEPEPTPEPEPEPEIVRPEPKPNTQEQAENEQYVEEQLSNGTSAITVSSGTINNLTVPSSTTTGVKITGELDDGATITSESPKYASITNTSEEPVNVTFEMEPGVTLYLPGGKYNDIYLDGNNISASSGKYAEIHGTVTIDPEVEGNVSISANFVGDDAGIVYMGNGTLTISNSGDEPSINVYAPNATVSVGGKYDEFEATVGEDTLILKSGFHTGKLVVKKGNVKFYGLDINDFADSVDCKGSVEPFVMDGISTSSPGVYVMNQDVEGNGLGFGTFATGKYCWKLNGHTYTAKRKDSYIALMRNTVMVNIEGPGCMTVTPDSNSYGIWNAGEGATTNIYGGDFAGITHCLYAEKGTINVYGGTFKLINADTADRDANGNLKFLLNCLDANYTSGIAHINVYGGKFYEFNPAVSYGEPNAPVSFVAQGYHVVESIEDGVKVFEVVKD